MLISEIKKFAKTKNFSKHTLIFRAGEKANGFYYVVCGEIRIYKIDRMGKEIEIDRFYNGDYFGEAVIFVSDKYQVYAEAVKPSTLLFFLKDVVLEKINQDPNILQFFIKLLAAKCVSLNKKIEILTMGSIKQRLIQFLLTEYINNQKKSFKLKFKKNELASQLGTISETLSRNLKQLQKSGFIEVKNKIIEIKDFLNLQKEIF